MTAIHFFEPSSHTHAQSWAYHSQKQPPSTERRDASFREALCILEVLSTYPYLYPYPNEGSAMSSLSVSFSLLLEEEHFSSDC